MSKIKYLALFLAFSVNADVFTLNSELNIQSSTAYTAQKEINVEVLDVAFNPTYGASAKILLNGEVKIVNVEQISQTSIGSYGSLTNFDAYAQVDRLVDGSYCDEQEVVKYIVNFDMEEERDPHAPNYFSVKSVQVQRTYYYDICHDFNPVIETLNYKRN